MSNLRKIQVHNMSKQRTNNNKGPANRRPASSKGRANANETGKRPKTSNSSRGASSSRSSARSEGSERSSRSSFDKKAPAKRSYTKRDEGSSDFKKKTGEGRGSYAAKKPSRSYGDNERSGPREEGSFKKRPVTRRDSSPEYRNMAGEGRSSSAAKKPSRAYDDKSGGRSAAGKATSKRSFIKKDENSLDFKRKPSAGRSSFAGKAFDEKDPSIKKRLSSFSDASEDKPRKRRSFPKPDQEEDPEGDNDFAFDGDSDNKKPKFDKSSIKKGKKSYENKLDKLSKTKPNAAKISVATPFETRLNKYISNSGVCSRREADQLILEGLVKVNGKVVTELGYKVQVGDSVKYNNKVLNPEKSVYVLLNKPKDFITTMEDENNRKTVMQLIANATKERIYPVGRLDRNTTGLLLFTNDGELAQKLTHPSNKVKKIYEVELDKSITAEDFDKIADGKIHLFDGPVKVDEIAIISPNKKILGIEIHEGRNRIVRRIFESLGYEVQKLDRVMYAGLTKKNVPRGSWRYLTATEVNKIKYLD